MFKRSIVAIMALAAVGAYAETVEVNLLQNAYLHTVGVFNDADEFFANWSCYFKDGTIVPASEWPNAGYSEVLLDEQNVPCFYTGASAEDPLADRIPGNKPASAEVFPAGMPLLKLIYPGGKNELLQYKNCSYNIPIQVPEDGEYTLSGSIAMRVNSSSNDTEISNYRLVLFAANPNPADGISSVGIIDGGISLMNGNNQPLVNVFMLGSQVLEQSMHFEKTIMLTTEDKYLSIFAPCGMLLLGDLKLTGNVEENPSLIDALEVGDVEPEYYDLSGRKISDPANLAAPGIYIERLPTATRKILK